MLREIFWFINENASWASDAYITILIVNIIKQAPMKSQNTITTLMQSTLLIYLLISFYSYQT